uniref:Ferritin/DPS domain-containing protein n=1 Tax=uncultured bacterium contig00003(2014) TaxID=1465624 RepID=A0A060CVX1_9BACT|nr:hypothetical protein [uncultured bacterium contig00003(2014)]
MFAILRQRATNLIDDLTTGLVNNMRFSDSDVLYPSDGKVEKGKGVEAEWFYDSFKAPNGTSELDTIHMYITQEAMFEELGELMMGIALVEMKHLDKLADLIKDLGGRVDRPNNTDKIEYGSTPEQAVRIAIAGETAAIKGYEALTERIAALPRNGTTRYTLSLLAKLLADERFHVALFEQWLHGNDAYE